MKRNTLNTNALDGCLTGRKDKPQELAAGVVYIVVGVGKIPTAQPAGVVVIPTPPAPGEENAP